MYKTCFRHSRSFLTCSKFCSCQTWLPKNSRYFSCFKCQTEVVYAISQVFSTLSHFSLRFWLKFWRFSYILAHRYCALYTWRKVRTWLQTKVVKKLNCIFISERIADVFFLENRACISIVKQHLTLHIIFEEYFGMLARYVLCSWELITNLVVVCIIQK